MFYKVSVNYDGLGAGVSVPLVSQNRNVFEGLARKHRLAQCLQRVGRPRARQHSILDGGGLRRGLRRASQSCKPPFRAALYKFSKLLRMQRVGRPRARQPQVLDDKGAATSDPELKTTALYEF